MTRTQAVDIGIRPYEDADEARVLRLLDDALGGGPAGRRTVDLFRWKHVDNPFGRSMMLVAESDGRIVGLRAFMRWRFLSGSRLLSAVRAVDTATHPDYQGRGIFSKLTREALEVLRVD
ncbi:MAG: GNAT family N-acetyltransferase, partial [Actinomycetota bacterium]